jgi:hypothetical protein
MLQDRAHKDLSTRLFGEKNLPIEFGKFALTPLAERQYILRMMVKHPALGISIPQEMNWIRPLFDQVFEYQRSQFVNHPFAYITVRHGIVNSSTDDLWHTDGFSIKKPHGPEQNYVWCDRSPTQFLNQAFPLPDDFDAMKHNLHHYFQDHADENLIVEGKAGHVYIMDPYVVHRRVPENTGMQRTFVRISFVPIEIEDNKNTQNPAFPVINYTNQDLRLSLTRYAIDRYYH